MRFRFKDEQFRKLYLYKNCFGMSLVLYIMQRTYLILSDVSLIFRYIKFFVFINQIMYQCYSPGLCTSESLYVRNCKLIRSYISRFHCCTGTPEILFLLRTDLNTILGNDKRYISSDQSQKLYRLKTFKSAIAAAQLITLETNYSITE